MQPLGVRLARGEAAAFDELYDACADRVYAYLLRRLGSPDDVADVMQETFLRLARGGSKWNAVRDPLAYCFTVARNESLRFAQRRSRNVPVCSDPEIATEDSRADLETREIVHRGLDRLEQEMREIVELKIFGGLTLAQIASALDLPPGTVATRYRRALQILRVQLKRELS